MKLKIVVLGDRAAGKTSLIQRYVFNTFSEVYQGTLGAKLHLLEFTKEISGQDIVEADIGLFDLMGEHSARDHFRDALFWGAHGFIAVCDVTRPETFDSLSEWIAIVGGMGRQMSLTAFCSTRLPSGRAPSLTPPYCGSSRRSPSRSVLTRQRENRG